jgi:hypothetical protein
MPVAIKITVFWDMKPYSLVDIYQCFQETGCLHLPHPEAGGSRFL